MKVSLLGSTGSIGRQTLEVVDNLGAEVVGLAAGRGQEILAEQVLKYAPRVVAVEDEDSLAKLKCMLGACDTRIVCGREGLMEVATLCEADIVVNSVVGSLGLEPTLAAIEAGKDVALANKESIVAGGALVMESARERGVRILPIDSEHSAILQCLAGNEKKSVRRIYLTASGGPFRGMSMEQLEVVTPEQALRHPTWSMGPKISIDSSTLMNKGLEVIEAVWLFGLSLEKIEVVVHPQSVVHSMVEFEDGSVMAQLGASDMRTAIQYALTHPYRTTSNYKKLDLFAKGGLSFEPPNIELFPCLGLAYEAMRRGGYIPAVLNAANEVAVEKFLGGKIGFTDIPVLIKKAMDEYNVELASFEDDKGRGTLAGIARAETATRDFVLER